MSRQPTVECRQCGKQDQVVWADSGVFSSKPYLYCRRCKLELDSRGWPVHVIKDIREEDFFLAKGATKEDLDIMEEIFSSDGNPIDPFADFDFETFDDDDSDFNALNHSFPFRMTL